VVTLRIIMHKICKGTRIQCLRY